MDSEKGWTLLFWAMVIMGVLAVLFRGGDVALDLSERANAELHGKGLQWASVKEVNGRNLVLTGESPVKAHRDRARDRVKKMYGVRRVDDQQISVKNPATPYTWAAIVATDMITLTGSVPDEKTRAAILDKVGIIVSDRAVTDKMVLTDGAPTVGWIENINNILKYTKFLKNGAVHLSDRSVKVEGEAWNSLDFEVIALRSSRGRTVNDYKFSSDLIPPINTSGQSLVTSAPSSGDAKEGEAPGEPEKTADVKAPEVKAEPVAKADKEVKPIAEPPAAETPAKTAGDDPDQTQKNPNFLQKAITALKEISPDHKLKKVQKGTEQTIKTVKEAAGKMTETPASSSDAKAPAKSETAETGVQSETPKSEPITKDSAAKTQADSKAAIVNEPVAKQPKAQTDAAAEIKTKTPEAAAKVEEKPVIAAVKETAKAKTGKATSHLQNQSGAGANIPPHMIAPPWGWAPYPVPPAGYYPVPPPAYYPAPPAVYPNCTYGDPYAPAYCGRPAYPAY